MAPESSREVITGVAAAADCAERLDKEVEAEAEAGAAEAGAGAAEEEEKIADPNRLQYDHRR